MNRRPIRAGTAHSGRPVHRANRMGGVMKWTVLTLLSLVQGVLAQTSTWRPVYLGMNGMVASGHYATAMAGYKMLEQGGNAVDAAAAAAFASTVVEPSRAGIGG